MTRLRSHRLGLGNCHLQGEGPARLSCSRELLLSNAAVGAARARSDGPVSGIGGGANDGREPLCRPE